MVNYKISFSVYGKNLLGGYCKTEKEHLRYFYIIENGVSLKCKEIIA